jgi:UTP-glucose-1-phosphate uridylyltransferase
VEGPTEIGSIQGLIVDGRRFDIGLPMHYLETLATLGQGQ